MKDRIRLLMDDQHLTQQDFAKLLEISPAQLSGIFNDRTKPTLNIVDAIHKKFPQVQLPWLLYGMPPMYINNEGTEDLGKGTSGMGENGHSGIEGLAFDFADEEDNASSAPNVSASSSSAAPSAAHARSSASPSVVQGSLFEQPQMCGVNRTLKNAVQENVKYIDKSPRKITEIRIFYDDQTWETFVPKK